jgi:tetratricopeptide (TPR) repeat protein
VTHEPGKVEASGDRSIAHKGDATGASFNTGDTHHHHYSPTPPAPPSALHQLARELSDFTGRTADLAILEAALNRDDGATVAITALHGMGGVGKTTLAQHAARRLIHRYPDAQIVLDLNGHGEGAPTAPLDAMLRVIRAFHPDTPPLDDPAQARAIYHSTLSGKRALILLDNAASADQIRDLIPPPHCGAIITARALVQPPDCTVLRLDLLSPDESAALLCRLAPNAQGTDDDWTRLADLCGRLPLALRVAGSTLAAADDLTLPDYLAELADEATRPHRLTIDSDATANVAVVLSHSLRRLIDQDPALAVRWQMLSVVPADFDRATTAALWDAAETAAAPPLRALRDRSLLLFDETTRRYRLHDLMRPLARNLFTPDPTQDPAPGTADRLAAAQGRFALHFMGVLEEATDLYERGHNGVAAGLARYDADSRNIAAAAAWAIDQADHDSTAQQVAAWLPNAGAYVLDLRLSQRERIVWLIAAIAAARRMSDPGLISSHLGYLGNAYADLGETRRAIEFYQQALAISQEIGDRRGEGNRLGSLGNAQAALGETRRAIEFYQQALGIAREIGDRRAEGTSLGNLGGTYAALGETRCAIEFYQQALAISQEIGDRRGEGSNLCALGIAHADLGETRHAIEFYQEALAIAQEIGDRRGEAQDLGNLGNAHAALGETQRAIEFHQQALAISRQIGDRQGEGQDLGNLGAVHAVLGEMRRSIAFHQQALIIAQEIGDRLGEGVRLGALGLAHADLGDVPTGITMTEQALAILVAIESPHAETARQQLALLRGMAAGG